MNNSHMHERRFHGEPDRLRSPERLELLEVKRVVALSTEALTIDSVLDVGTGTGIFAEEFSMSSTQVAGIDVNSELLAVAREHVPGGTFREALAEKLPFEDHTFDLVFLGHVLHETDDPLKALEEAHRVARKRAAVLEWPYQADEQVGPPIDHRLKPEAIIDLGNKAGFQQVERIQLAHMDFYRLTP